MFAGGAFAEFGFCEHSYTPLDTSAFEAFLAEVTSRRCWLLELDAFSLAVTGGVSSAFADHGFGDAGFSDAQDQAVGGERTLRFATSGYTSQAGDTPASTFYEPRLLAPPLVDRQIAGRDGIGGLTTVYAEISLNNRDGGLDTLLRDYALDGRRARILVGRGQDPLTGEDGDALADFGVVFSGVFQSAVIGEREMRVVLSDGSAKLLRLVNEAVYAGSGGLEGGDDLKGKAKPAALGEVYNVAPPLVDSAKLIYQVHDGLASDVPAAYDRQVALTKGSDYASEADMNATAPSAGQYRVWKSSTGSWFRLGATPAGTVTADVLGDATGSYVDTTAEIVQRLLSQRAGLNNSEIDPASIGALTVAAPAPVGHWTGIEPQAVGEVVDSLLYGIGAFGGFARNGAFTVGLVADATGVTEAATYGPQEIVSVEREPLPASVAPIAWRVGVGWRRNYTVMTDVAASVTAARRTFAAEAQRVSSTEDAAIKSRHLLAVELGPVEAHYADEADAQAERDRLFALWGVERQPYRVVTKMPALPRELGQVVRLEGYPRHGLASGVSARVLGQRIEGSRVELRVLV